MKIKLVKRIFCMVGIVFLSACTAKNVQDVGIGMQVGAASGTPLAPAVAVAGAVTEIVGKVIGDGGGVDKNTPEYQAALRFSRRMMVRTELFRQLKTRLRPTPFTTQEQISVASKAVCSEFEKLQAAGGQLKMSRAFMKPMFPSTVPEGEGDEFLFQLTEKPFDTTCVAEVEAAGGRIVAMEHKRDDNQ